MDKAYKFSYINRLNYFLPIIIKLDDEFRKYVVLYLCISTVRLLKLREIQ